MNDDERKPRMHIHTGGLIIFIIIILVLFKVDIKSKIKSPQFQKNLTYIEDTIKDFYKKNISDPLRIKTGDFFINVTNKELKKIQDNFTTNVIKTPTQEEIDEAADSNN